MKDDPIVEEVRRVRQEHAKRFNYDMKAIVADLKQGERAHAERLVSFDPKPPRKRRSA